MIDCNKKLLEIKRIVDIYLRTLERKPQMLGSIEEIESSFFLIDQINIILTYGIEYNDEDLSWRSFLVFKGIGGANEIAAKTIKKDKEPFCLLVSLRNEYYKWLDMKISHKDNPNDSPLIELLKQVDERESYELIRWFEKYPSEKAIRIYLDRINNNYIDFPRVSKGLARMGDRGVYEWANNQLKHYKKIDERKLALECVAVSPLKEADDVLGSIVQSNRVDDIDCLVCAFGNSANKKKFEWIDQIISLPIRNEVINASIELVLTGVLIHENRIKSFELLEKMKCKVEKGYSQ